MADQEWSKESKKIRLRTALTHILDMLLFCFLKNLARLVTNLMPF